MDKEIARNPQKFEPHGNYQPYGVKTVCCEIPVVREFPESYLTAVIIQI